MNLSNGNSSLDGTVYHRAAGTAGVFNTSPLSGDNDGSFDIDISAYAPEVLEIETYVEIIYGGETYTSSHITVTRAPV